MASFLLVRVAKLHVFSMISFPGNYMYMTLHAMLMIHMQKLAIGYSSKKKNTFKYS